MIVRIGDVFKDKNNRYYRVEEVKIKVFRNNEWIAGVGFRCTTRHEDGHKDNYIYVLPVNEFLNKFERVEKSKQQLNPEKFEFPAVRDEELLFFPY